MDSKTYSRQILGFVLCLTLCFSLLRVAKASECFLKDGDRWSFFGDSITATGTYIEVTEQVFRHFHPAAKVTFINNGHSGLQLAAAGIEAALKGDPDVVSIMLGMNDAINADWVKGMPREPKLAKYKASLVKLVRELKVRGKAVVILTPTLTDESCGTSLFRIEGTQALLLGMGRACEQVAREESVALVPVQSEMESYSDALPGHALLRTDGVHPAANGHYQIARSLWRHLNFQAELSGGRRRVTPPPDSLGLSLGLPATVLPPDSETVDFALSAPTSREVKISWSSGAARSADSVNLTGQGAWTLKLPREVIPREDGKAARVVIDVAGRGVCDVFIVDIFRNKVLHSGDGGEFVGSLVDEAGHKICVYSFRRDGQSLLFEAQVSKPQVVHDNAGMWPWSAGDVLCLFLDLRPGTRFAGLGMDADVYQLWFRPRMMPAFSPGLLPWSGRHAANIMTPFGEKTPSGYKVGVLVDGYVNILRKVDISTQDFVGFNLSLICAESAGGTKSYALQKTDREDYLFPGCYQILDLNNRLRSDSALAASVF